MSIFDFFKKKAKNEKKNNSELKSFLLSIEKNEIVMEVDNIAKNISPSQSKFGGKPWLPSGFEWPVFTNPNEGKTRPLSFLCQINVADVKKYDSDGLLPNCGMLYFFYECESFCWGGDRADKGCARVFYFENTEDFASMELPKQISKDYIVPEMAVCFTARKSYPKYEELEIYSDIDCEWEDYDELLEKMGVDMEMENHKLLGYADIIQNEMLSECECVSRELCNENAESNQTNLEDESASIQHSAKDWTLLLQLSTLQNGDWELMWGDCGMLYFYIKKQDLAEKRFENAWFSLQCA